jgi:hypothetical protein
MVYNGEALNNSNVSITNLWFTHVYLGGTNQESIEASFTISARTPEGALISESATTTRYLHK